MSRRPDIAEVAKHAKVSKSTVSRGINGGFIYIRSANNVPLCGTELFYTEDQKVLANVATGRHVSGVMYSPPSQ